MQVLGSGLKEGGHLADTLSVGEAELSMLLRLGASQDDMLMAQTNLANTYAELGRDDEAMGLRRDVYSEYLKLKGEEHMYSLQAANNYATSLLDRHRYAEARSLLHRTIPVAQRVLGASNEFTLKMRGCHADSLCWDPSATLSELREAVTEFEDLARDARRVFGSAHPFVVGPIGRSLQNARAVLRARETPSGEV